MELPCVDSVALDRESEHMRFAANGPRSVQHIAATLRLSGALGGPGGTLGALELLVEP